MVLMVILPCVIVLDAIVSYLSLCVFLGIPFAFVFATVDTSIVRAFKELMEFKHVSFNDAVFLCIFFSRSLGLGKEHVFV